jgi:6-pyruvoyl-tetrahydropterin synthase
VTTEYKSEQLDDNGIVIDISKAHEVLSAALEPIRYRNLDEVAAFAGQNTTTEVMARYLHGAIADRVRGVFSGALRVVLEESHVAWGSYEAPV